MPRRRSSGAKPVIRTAAARRSNKKASTSGNYLYVRRATRAAGLICPECVAFGVSQGVDHWDEGPFLAWTAYRACKTCNRFIASCRRLAWTYFMSHDDLAAKAVHMLEATLNPDHPDHGTVAEPSFVADFYARTDQLLPDIAERVERLVQQQRDQYLAYVRDPANAWPPPER